MADLEAAKAEEQRQCQIMTDAIQKTIMEVGKQFECPMMNALAGALIGVEAAMVNSIPAGQPRQALIKTMKKERIRAYKTVKPTSMAQVVVMGGHDA